MIVKLSTQLEYSEHGLFACSAGADVGVYQLAQLIDAGPEDPLCQDSHTSTCCATMNPGNALKSNKKDATLLNPAAAHHELFSLSTGRHLCYGCTYAPRHSKRRLAAKKILSCCGSGGSALLHVLLDAEVLGLARCQPEV